MTHLKTIFQSTVILRVKLYFCQWGDEGRHSTECRSLVVIAGVFSIRTVSFTFNDHFQT
jgi:hypothetical protein